MRFFKQLKFDLIYGNFKGKTWIKYAVWVTYLLFVCFEIRGMIVTYSAEEFTLGDSIYYVFAGVRSKEIKVYAYPYLWLLVNSLILYFTLHYTHDDLSAYGQQTIIRSEKRVYWYLSKCIWNVSAVLIFYLILWLMVSLFTLIIGGKFTFELTPFADEIKLTDGSKPSEVGIMVIEMVVMPPLMTIAMSVFQMGLSMVFKPIFAYIFSAAMLLASADRVSPFLIGNYAMVIRSDKISANGVNAYVGICIAIGMIIAGVIMGAIAIRKYNILSKE